MSATAQHLMFFRHLFKIMKFSLAIPTPISVDNLPAIRIATDNESAFQRTRHINVRFHFVKSLIKDFFDVLLGERECDRLFT